MVRTKEFSLETIDRALAKEARENTKFVEWEQPDTIIVKCEDSWWRIHLYGEVNEVYVGRAVRPTNKDIIVDMQPVYKNVRVWEEKDE